MPSGQWRSSNRKAELPANWDAIRRARFELDDWRCTEELATGGRCKAIATDCDHIGDRHDHRLEMLRSRCSPHHAAKSSYEGVEARAQRKARARLPQEEHPGFLPAPD